MWSLKTAYAIKEQDKTRTKTEELDEVLQDKTRTKAQGLEEVLDVELEDGLHDQGAGQDKD